MDLAVGGILGDGPFVEVGQPTGVYRARDGATVAVAGTFGISQWNGRATGGGQRLGYRVAVYEAGSLRRVGLLDRARYPVNDVAFHPQRPLVAVATGAYDGGFFYEGELLLWDLATGAAVSLLDEEREVARVRFSEDGRALHVALRPPTDEGEGDDAPVSLDTTIAGGDWPVTGDASVRVADLPAPVARVGTRAEGGPAQGPGAVAAALAALAARAGLRHEPRGRLWDLAWPGDDRLLAAGAGTALECWAADGSRPWRLPADGAGTQVLVAPDAASAYVGIDGGWRHRPTPDAAGPGRVTRVERIDLATRRRAVVTELASPAALSLAASGHLLARDTDHLASRGGKPTRDRVVAPGGAVSPPLDLGHYDLFNHYLRIDGAPHLYFLQGTPARRFDRAGDAARPHERKWVCRLAPATLAVERLFPLEWDARRAGQLWHACGAYLRDGGGEGLALATVLFAQRSWPGFVARRALPDGRPTWVTAVPAQVTAMLPLPDAGALLCALADGGLLALDARDGRVRGRRALAARGAPTVALALAARGDRVAAGTIDGRILLLDPA